MQKITREYLETLPLWKIKALDINTKEEEALVQEFIDKKTVNVLPEVKFNHRLVPDIKTPEDEAKWQSTVDEFYDGLKPIDIQIEEAQAELASLTEFVPIEVDEIPTIQEVSTETEEDTEAVEELPIVEVLNVEVKEQPTETKIELKKNTKTKKTK